MFPEPTELLLIAYSIDSIWTPSKSNTLTAKTNSLADILTKGNFTRDEWNHLLCLFNISHFSSTNFSEVMSKRTQKDSGEKRVTAKSKPMMNLVSRCSERTPDVFASTASESPGKARYESQLLLSSWTEQHLRTGRLVDEHPPGLFTQHTDRFIVDEDDMDSDTVAESDMSLKSRSFLHKVNDRVRKMQKQSSKDATQDSNKHSENGECSCLRHYKHLYSWERIIWKIYIPSKIQEKISR